VRARPFYLLACVLAIVAVVVSGVSKKYAGRAAMAAAQAAGAHSPEEREALHSAAHLAADQSDRLSSTAAAASVLAMGAWVCSLWRREGGLQSVPLLLVVVAILLQLLMV
jgi:hypothetical protein